jgi:hypothetical protein
MLPTSEPIPAPGSKTSKTDTTAVALLGAMLLVLATLGGASLSAGASGALQEIIHTFEPARPPRAAVGDARPDRLDPSGAAQETRAAQGALGRAVTS